MRYGFAPAKWEGVFASYDDIVVTINSTIEEIKGWKGISNRRRKLILNMLGACRDHIGNERWKGKP